MNGDALVKKTTKIMFGDAGISGTAQYMSQLVWVLFLKVFDYKEEEWELEENYIPVIHAPFRFRDWADPRKKNGEKIYSTRLTGEKLIDFINNVLFPYLQGKQVKFDDKIVQFTSEDPKAYIVREFMSESQNYMKDGVRLRQLIDEIADIDFDDVSQKHDFNEFYERLLKELQNGGKATGEFYTPRAITKFITDHVNPKIGERVADFACGTGGFLAEAISHLQKQAKSVKDNEIIQDSIYGIEWKQLPYMLATTNMLLHNIDNPKIIHDDGLALNVLDLSEQDMFECVLMNPPFGGEFNKADLANFPNDLASSESADLFVARIIYCLKKKGRCGLVLPDGLLFNTDDSKVALKRKLLTECNLHTVIRLPKTVFAPYTDINTNLLFFDKTGKTKEVWFYRLDMPFDRKHFNKTNPIRREDLSEIDEWWNNRHEIKDEQVEGSSRETWKSQKYSFEFLEKRDFDIDLCGYPEQEEIVLSPEEVMSQYYQEREELQKKLSKATFALKEYIDGKSVELFDIRTVIERIAELDKAFPDDIRKSLLQAAMQGNLTTYEDGDSSVEEYLIANDIPVVEDGELDDIPDGWRYVKMEDIVSIPIKRGKTPKYVTSSSVYVFAQKCNQKNGIVSLDKAQLLDESLLKKYEEQDFISANDIVINSTGNGTLGRIGYIEEELLAGDKKVVPDTHVTVIRVKEGILPQYIFAFLRKNQTYLESKGVGSTKQTELRPDTIKELIVPLPPIEEQVRIVKKLNETLPLVEVKQEGDD